MINAYYLIENGLQTGPFSHIDLMDQGLAPDALVLSPVANDWQSASDLPEFHEYFQLKGINLPTVQNAANFWWRLLAYLIDYVIVIMLLALFGLAYGILARFVPDLPDLLSGDDDLGLRVFLFLMIILYNAICEATRMQGSIGKKILKLKVVTTRGERVSLRTSLARNFGKILSSLLCGAGFLKIFADKRRQGWHDELAKTYVVRIK